jgi:hypothetical protein
MTKSKALALIELLSAIESWAFSHDKTIPDYLHDNLHDSLEALRKIVLEGEK